MEGASGKVNFDSERTLAHWFFSAGQRFARSSMWIAVASLLATSNMNKAVDGTGNTTEPSVKYSSAFIKSVPFELFAYWHSN